MTGVPFWAGPLRLIDRLHHGVSSTERGAAPWLHDSSSPVSASPVSAVDAPGVSLASTVRSPAASEASMLSMLHEVVSVHGSPSISAGAQAEAPPVGLVETTAWPGRSTATQSVADGHETDTSCRPLSIAAPSP